MIDNINKSKITDKRIIFAEQYLIHNRNGTIAYKAVYGQDLHDNTAAVNASKLLRNAQVQEYLRKRFSVLELDTDYVLSSLKNLAENSKSDGIKLQALVAIGKSIGMFSNTVVVDAEADREARSSYIINYVKNEMFKPYINRPKELSQ
ncbi:MAG: terminase small subunit [Sphaerochaetaceae bacterium]